MTLHAIVSNKSLTPMTRVVHVALHDLADDAGRIEARISDLAAHLKTDNCTVIRALQALEAAALLVVERRGSKGVVQVLRLLDAAQAA